MEELIYNPTKEQVARALLNSGSYLIKDDESLLSKKDWYRWKSGIEAPTYANCRYLMGNPGASAVVVQSLVSSIKNNFPGVELIVGIESAGIHWSSTVAMELGLPTAFIRKEPKAHGVDEGKFVGSPGSFKGITALIIDDLVASGGSIETAVSCLRDEKQINVIGIQSIINWNFSLMHDRFRRLEIPVKALVSYPQILSEAFNQDIIDNDVKEELLFFYQNPKFHAFNFEFLKTKLSRKASNF